ncbi:MAG: hypothetical protein H0T46_31980 [Deltaproteobacteria bacterium]|nr:hypothetical protein [Deltaproteobacteria bacterium]
MSSSTGGHLAMYCDGRRKLKLGDFFVMLSHATEVEASRPPSWLGRKMFNGVARLARLFGAKPLPLVGAW